MAPALRAVPSNKDDDFFPHAHGVLYNQRRNEHGQKFDHDVDNYQEGPCDSCGEMLYAARENLYASFTPWLLKSSLQFVITEEPDLEDILTL